eukprot:COSAG02_NODE_57700_length_279_cov_2.311111_1_plen_76_part_01
MHLCFLIRYPQSTPPRLDALGIMHTIPTVTMDAFRTRIASGLTAHGCPLSPEQITALQQVLVSAAKQDEGLPMVME